MIDEPGAGLDARLLAAHEAGDPSILAALYAEASCAAEGEAAAFYLTHAWIFALEAGDPSAARHEADLRGMRRA